MEGCNRLHRVHGCRSSHSVVVACSEVFQSRRKGKGAKLRYWNLQSPTWRIHGASGMAYAVKRHWFAHFCLSSNRVCREFSDLPFIKHTAISTGYHPRIHVGISLIFSSSCTKSSPPFQGFNQSEYRTHLSTHHLLTFCYPTQSTFLSTRLTKNCVPNCYLPSTRGAKDSALHNVLSFPLHLTHPIVSCTSLYSCPSIKAISCFRMLPRLVVHLQSP